jgi:hypothetical protein
VGTRDVATVGSVASSCASSRRGEDDDVLLIFIRAKRYAGPRRAVLGRGCWAAWWATRPGKSR